MYRIEIKKSALKELSQIPSPYNKKIIEAIDELATDPRPVGYKKLKGSEAYRIRVSDYRIVYTIEDVIQLIEIERIRHRKDVYRP
jgi:mRNA interferase RelE/StbE